MVCSRPDSRMADGIELHPDFVGPKGQEMNIKLKRCAKHIAGRERKLLVPMDGNEGDVCVWTAAETVPLSREELSAINYAPFGYGAIHHKRRKDVVFVQVRSEKWSISPICTTDTVMKSVTLELRTPDTAAAIRTLKISLDVFPEHLLIKTK